MRGKSDTCEDAFFVSERSFGVADGVSGWNDFGFSSQEFATQLMSFSKQEAEQFDKQPGEKLQEKKELQRIRKRGSFLNFELDETSEETPSSQVT